MKISYNWLKLYLNVDWDVEKVGELLTDLGLEVEGIDEVESIKGGLKGVVVGKVLTCEKHPNADKLSVTTVDLGEGDPVQIVCGAPNVAAGQTVPVATVGTKLYFGDEEVKIKKGKIRGEVSFGMICAEDELGLGKSHDGIMVLDNAIEAGTKAAEVFEVDSDFTIEIGLTPNRADAMSHYGVARDLWVGLKRYGHNFELKEADYTSFKVDNEDLPIEIEVENKERAPRYVGVTLNNIEVKDSPEWMQKHLKAIGLNPINNVVDITNYVLHEMGQPLHAFDYQAVAGKKVIVKTLPEGTKFTTLDDVERELHSEDLMICNEQEAMCIAGVFGGAKSGVKDSTTSIFLESAYFNPVSVRKTSKRHGLNTDASFRFERGIDPNITVKAIKRACVLLKEYAGAQVSSQIIDLYPEAIEDFTFDVNLDKINKLIGKNIEKEMVLSILKDLEIEILSDNGDDLSLKVPAFRNDVQREADIVEEILRVYGYNNVEFGEKLNSSISYSEGFNFEKANEIIANQLSSLGFNEMMANSLTSANYSSSVESINQEHDVKILNPLSSDLGVMRQSLLFGGLESISHNIKRKRADVKLYEFGKSYHKIDEKYTENKHLAIFLTGKQNAESWFAQQQPASFYYLKSVAQNVIAKMGITDLKEKANQSDIFTESIILSKGKIKLAELGVVSPKVLKNNDIKQEVYYADLNWDNILKLAANNDVKFKDLPKFPEVRRDLALVLDSDVNYIDLYKQAFQTERNLLTEVNLFDVYEGDKLEKGKKSYAMSFIFRDDTKTLTDKIIEKAMSKLLSTFEKQFEAKLR
jgi:phenylalanyl-tRNA synthetase beta chain